MNYLTKKLGMCIIYSVGYTPCASIAQSVEHFTRNEGVVGSSPIFSFSETFAIYFQVVGVFSLCNC